MVRRDRPGKAATCPNESRNLAIKSPNDGRPPVSTGCYVFEIAWVAVMGWVMRPYESIGLAVRVAVKSYLAMHPQASDV